MNLITDTLPAEHDKIRLITRVARLYHDAGMGQSAIADKLGLSQARVSRLLKQAEQMGIVRISVQVPNRVHADLEEALEKHYNLDEVIVVELDVEESDDIEAEAEEPHHQALSSAMASYLELTLPTMKSVGVASFSSTLLAGLEAMRPVRINQSHASSEESRRTVVQLLGGLGNGSSSLYASRLTERLAQLTSAEAIAISAPGVVDSQAAREAIIKDSSSQSALASFDALSAVLLGVGTLPTANTPAARRSVFSNADLAELAAAGAVGDICLRFFDADGRAVSTSFDERVIGIQAEQLQAAPRRIAVAGGRRKFEAIRGALRGNWLSTLITDLQNAQRLIEQP